MVDKSWLNFVEQGHIEHIHAPSKYFDGLCNSLKNKAAQFAVKGEGAICVILLHFEHDIREHVKSAKSRSISLAEYENIGIVTIGNFRKNNFVDDLSENLKVMDKFLHGHAARKELYEDEINDIRKDINTMKGQIKKIGLVDEHTDLRVLKYQQQILNGKLPTDGLQQAYAAHVEDNFETIIERSWDAMEDIFKDIHKKKINSQIMI